MHQPSRPEVGRPDQASVHHWGLKLNGFRCRRKAHPPQHSEEPSQLLPDHQRHPFSLFLQTDEASIRWHPQPEQCFWYSGPRRCPCPGCFRCNAWTEQSYRSAGSQVNTTGCSATTNKLPTIPERGPAWSLLTFVNSIVSPHHQAVMWSACRRAARLIFMPPPSLLQSSDGVKPVEPMGADLLPDPMFARRWKLRSA